MAFHTLQNAGSTWGPCFRDLLSSLSGSRPSLLCRSLVGQCSVCEVQDKECHCMYMYNYVLEHYYIHCLRWGSLGPPLNLTPRNRESDRVFIVCTHEQGYIHNSLMCIHRSKDEIMHSGKPQLHVLHAVTYVQYMHAYVDLPLIAIGVHKGYRLATLQCLLMIS